MKTLFLLSAAIFLSACDAKVSVPPTESKTTIVNPTTEKKEEKTTIVNPAPEKKTESTTKTETPGGTTVEKSKTETR